MANSVIIKSEMANEVVTINAALKELRKNAAYKAAKEEYQSLSHVLKEMKSLFTTKNGGYDEILATFAVESSCMLKPNLLKQLAEELSQVIDGKVYNGYYKTNVVYQMVASKANPMRNVYLRNEDGERIPVMENGKEKTQTVFVPIRAWNPEKVITLLMWDRALRLSQFMKVIAAKDPKKSIEDVTREAETMYKDYVAAKFVSKKKSAPTSKNSKKQQRA